MKEENREPDYFRIAADFYQCNALPDDYLKMQEDAFYELLAENAWEPFVDWLGSNIEEEIQALSACMEKIARDAYARGYKEAMRDAEQENEEHEQAGGAEPVSIYDHLSTAFCDAIKK